LKAKNFHTRLK